MKAYKNLSLINTIQLEVKKKELIVIKRKKTIVSTPYAMFWKNGKKPIEHLLYNF